MRGNQQLASQLCCYLDSILVSSSIALDKAFGHRQATPPVINNKNFFSLQVSQLVDGNLFFLDLAFFNHCLTFSLLSQLNNLRQSSTLYIMKS